MASTRFSFMSFFIVISSLWAFVYTRTKAICSYEYMLFFMVDYLMYRLDHLLKNRV